MRRTILLTFLVGILASTSMSAARLTLETIQLQSRPAEELIPLIKPFLAPEGALTGQGYKLIVKTTPDNLGELKKLVADLDIGQRQLLVTVTMDDRALNTERGANISGQLSTGDSSVKLGKSGDSDQKDRVSAQIYSTQSRKSTPGTYYVKTTEGQWATINVGTSYPVRERVRTAHGTEIERVVLVNAPSGFQVLPQINGDQVTLRVRPYRSGLEEEYRHAIQYSDLDTVVRGRLGTWINLGGATKTMTSHHGTLTSTTRDRSDLTTNMAIKVELASDR